MKKLSPMLARVGISLAWLAALAITGAAAQTDPDLAPVMIVPGQAAADILRRCNLSELLQNGGERRGVVPLNGFAGPDGYRIELALTRIVRVPRHPSHYQVWGKTRYKNRIVSFTGMINFTTVENMRSPLAAYSQTGQYNYKADQKLEKGAAKGTYELREDAAVAGAGTFRGTITMDIVAEKSGRVTLYKAPAYDYFYFNGNVVLDGVWASAATSYTRPVVWMHNLFAYNYWQSPLFADFMLGERDPQINPRYAKLGWNKYWENDEWWADSPAPLASFR